MGVSLVVWGSPLLSLVGVSRGWLLSFAFPSSFVPSVFPLPLRTSWRPLPARLHGGRGCGRVRLAALPFFSKNLVGSLGRPGSRLLGVLCPLGRVRPAVRCWLASCRSVAPLVAARRCAALPGRRPAVPAGGLAPGRRLGPRPAAPLPPLCPACSASPAGRARPARPRRPLRRPVRSSSRVWPALGPPAFVPGSPRVRGAALWSPVAPAAARGCLVPAAFSPRSAAFVAFSCGSLRRCSCALVALARLGCWSPASSPCRRPRLSPAAPPSGRVAPWRSALVQVAGWRMVGVVPGFLAVLPRPGWRGACCLWWVGSAACPPPWLAGLPMCNSAVRCSLCPPSSPARARTPGAVRAGRALVCAVPALRCARPGAGHL